MTIKIHDMEPTAEGFHPDYPHLAFFECKSHYDAFIITSPAKEGDFLIEPDTDEIPFDGAFFDRGYGYFDSSLLDMIED